MTKFIISFSLLFLSLSLFSQSKKAVVLTVEDEKITVEDFESIFKKNNRNEAISPAALDEYMELFITFRLKVREAREMGLDTTSAFKNELSGYRKQLARPYLTDGTMLDKLIEEAYERKKTEVKASHILIQVEPSASPVDTLKAWSRIMKLRERVTTGKEDFATVAKGKGGSEDPSAQQNGGNLGYFSAFQMVHPFEHAAYTTPVGQVSQPVRTRFGYHLVKVEDKRPARGEIKVAHIMIRAAVKGDPESEKEAERRITAIYDQVVSGTPFAELATKFSEDVSSQRQGGELAWFGTGKMVEAFEEASFTLEKDGDISKPFKTEYGWHVVKRLEYRSVPSFDEMKSELRNKVSRDSRAEVTRTSMVSRLKKEYNLRIDEKTWALVLKKADTSAYNGQLKVKEKELAKPLMGYAGKVLTLRDFKKFLENNPTKERTDIKAHLNNRLNLFAEQEVMNFEDGRLEQKHNDFRLLMNEYHDGILLFELTDQKVWNKAVKDTMGLKEFHKNNERNYMWPERAQVTIFTCATPEIARDMRKQLAAGKKTVDQIVGDLNKTGALNVGRESGLFTFDEKEVLTKIERKKGLSKDVTMNGNTILVQVDDVMPPKPKTLDESKGQVTADYQAHLEKLWITELRSKYKFTVDKKVLHSIK